MVWIEGEGYAITDGKKGFTILVGTERIESKPTPRPSPPVESESKTKGKRKYTPPQPSPQSLRIREFRSHWKAVRYDGLTMIGVLRKLIFHRIVQRSKEEEVRSFQDLLVVLKGIEKEFEDLVQSLSPESLAFRLQNGSPMKFKREAIGEVHSELESAELTRESKPKKRGLKLRSK